MFNDVHRSFKYCLYRKKLKILSVETSLLALSFNKFKYHSKCRLLNNHQIVTTQKIQTKEIEKKDGVSIIFD